MGAVGIASLLYAGFFFVKMKLRAPAAPADEGALLREVRARRPIEEPVHPLPEPPGRVLDGWIETTLTLEEPRRYPTEDGEDLELQAGNVDAAFCLRFRPERSDEDETDALIAGLRIRSMDGERWETETFLDQDALVLPFSSPRRAEESAGRILFWEDVPAEWRQAMQSNCRITGVRLLLDSRECFELPVGDDTVTMRLKYQGPIVDLAWLASQRRLVARASGLYYERRQDDELEQSVDQVTFGYLLAPREILLPTAPDLHWVQWEEWFEADGEERMSPVFRQLAAS